MWIAQLILLKLRNVTGEKLPAIERGAYLRKIAERIREREPEITQTIVNEGGKTFDLAKVEVLFTADYLDYMAEWARRYEGEIVQSDRKDEHILLIQTSSRSNYRYPTLELPILLNR